MSKPLPCPACNARLDQIRWQEALELDICRACGGIWFDFGEMVLLADSDSLENIDRKFHGTYQELTEQELVTQRDAPGRLCPKDETELERHEYAGDATIMLDYCPACRGTWMDAGELEGYVAAQKKWQKDPPRASREQLLALDQLAEQTNQEITERTLAVNTGYLDGIADFIWRIKSGFDHDRRKKYAESPDK